MYTEPLEGGKATENAQRNAGVGKGNESGNIG